MTPLHVAAEKGRIKIVEYFVKERADVNIQDCNGVSIHRYNNCKVGLLQLT